MRMRTEVQLAVMTLLAIQVATSLGTSGLLSRISPAIERIFTENVRTQQGTEDMMAALALDGSADAEQRHTLFENGLATAEGNITEPQEKPILDRIEVLRDEAMRQPGTARHNLVDSLRDLSAINRTAMRRADDDAKRLGVAGAWSAVLLGLLSFVASFALSRRLVRRLEHPIAELDATLQAARQGDLHRRVHAQEIPEDLRRIVLEVNRILDLPLEPPPAPVSQPTDRAALNLLLEQQPDPMIVVAPEGEMRAANDAALEVLGGEEGKAARETLEQLPQRGAATGWTVAPLPGDVGWLCMRHAQRHS